MQEKYIDVDYQEIDETKEKVKDKDIVINADPLSALISGAFSSINNLTNAVKEYTVCKQQEETKRADIKAKMKVEIEKINAQKELYLKYIDNKHEEEMLKIQNFYQQYGIKLDHFSNAIYAAVEVAKETKNFSDVCMLLELEHTIMKENSEVELKFMELSHKNNYLTENNPIKGFIG